jgi:hypothetical protein
LLLTITEDLDIMEGTVTGVGTDNKKLNRRIKKEEF